MDGWIQILVTSGWIEWMMDPLSGSIVDSDGLIARPADGAGSNQLGSTNLNGLRRQNAWFKRCGTKNTAILTSSSLKSISLSNQGSLRIPSKSTSTDHEPSHQLPPHYLDQATMNLLLGRRA